MKRFICLCFSSVIFYGVTNAQWTLVNNGLSNTGVFSFSVNGSEIFVGNNIGVCSTIDNGADWMPLLSGIAPVTALATDGVNIFAGSDGSGIFLSTNDGADWTPVDSNLTTDFIFALSTDGTNIFAGTDSGVFLSVNNGTSWTEKNNGLTHTDIRSIAIDGEDIFAGSNDGGIFLSDDNGSTWNPINVGLPLNVSVRCIKISGTNILIGTDMGIYISFNAGNSWNAINTGLLSTNIYSLTVWGTILFAGTEEDGIYISENNGASWEAFNTGFPGFGIAFALAANSTNIFAAMYSDGVYTRLLSEITGLNDMQEECQFEVYPNPADEFVNIQTNYSGDMQFALYNTAGMQMTYQIITDKSNQIDLSRYSNGIYFYTLKDSTHILKHGIIVHQ